MRNTSTDAGDYWEMDWLRSEAKGNLMKSNHTLKQLSVRIIYCFIQEDARGSPKIGEFRGRLSLHCSCYFFPCVFLCLSWSYACCCADIPIPILTTLPICYERHY